MAEYKVGDKVRITKDKSKSTQWNDFGRMDKWLGKVMTIRCCGGDCYRMEEDIDDNEWGGWYWYPGMIDGLASKTFPKVVITTDGKTTLARYYEDGKVVKRGEAKCCPSDEFDFAIGAKLAYERCMGTIKVEGKTLTTKDIKWRAVKRAAKAGDYVRLKKCSGLFHFDRAGDICKVTRLSINGAIYVSAEDHITAYEDKDRGVGDIGSNCWTYLSSEYEVVVPIGWLEHVEEKPTYYSGKVVCTDSNTEDFTTGKVYEVKRGKLIDNKGNERPGGVRATSVDALNNACYCHKSGEIAHVHFVPFVED